MHNHCSTEQTLREHNSIHVESKQKIQDSNER